MASVFDNVRFEVVESTTDADFGVTVPDTVLEPNMVGHLQDMLMIPEGQVRGLSERDRNSNYRLIVQFDSLKADTLKPGLYIRVTYTRHPRTKGWRQVDKSKNQYLISSVTEVTTDDGSYNIGLTKKDV